MPPVFAARGPLRRDAREATDTPPSGTAVQAGILMLDTKFPRLAGDIGRPDSFAFPVLHRVVAGAGVEHIVTDKPLPSSLAEAFLEAAQQLQRQGAPLIATSCGFLSSLQAPLQRQLQVPFLSSALLLLPLLRAQYGADAKIGVITFDAERLNAAHIPLPPSELVSLCIVGLKPDDELSRVIKHNQPRLDRRLCERQILARVRELHRAQPELRAIVLECTNLSHWKKQMRRLTGLPVFDLVDLIAFFADSFSPSPAGRGLG